MRLLAVTPVAFPGGAEGALLGLLRSVRDRGWDVTVAAPVGESTERARAVGFRTIEIPELRVPAGPRVLGLARVAGRARRAARVIRRAGASADLVVANGLFVLPSIRWAHLRAPVVHLARGVVARRDWAALVRRFGSVATVTVAPSAPVARAYLERGLDVRVVHHGTEWPVDPARAEHDGAPIVGVTAYLTALKGQDVLLDAVARLDRPDVVVELAGGFHDKDRGFADRLRARAEYPDLRGRVRFLGHVEDVLERMRGWRVMAVPSVYPEAAGLTMLEAMSIGVPIVAAAHGGPAELLDGAGLLVPPRDVAALAEAIGRLLDDPDLHSQCAEAGRRLVEERLNAAREERELLEILDEVAGSARAG